jgi:hypothetical protein
MHAARKATLKKCVEGGVLTAIRKTKKILAWASRRIAAGRPHESI